MTVSPIIEERNLSKSHSLFPFFKTVGFLQDSDAHDLISNPLSQVESEPRQEVWNRGSGIGSGTECLEQGVWNRGSGYAG